MQIQSAEPNTWLKKWSLITGWHRGPLWCHHWIAELGNNLMLSWGSSTSRAVQCLLLAGVEEICWGFTYRSHYLTTRENPCIWWGLKCEALSAPTSLQTAALSIFLSFPFLVFPRKRKTLWAVKKLLFYWTRCQSWQKGLEKKKSVRSLYLKAVLRWINWVGDNLKKLKFQKNVTFFFLFLTIVASVKKNHFFFHF